MTIIECYIEKQNDSAWVNEYQSTAQDKHGKNFNCLNVNFRSLRSYYVQIGAFKSKDGLKRSEWNDYQETGQEKDKQRIQPLKNAKLLISLEDRYFITNKGKLIIDIKENDSLNDKEKWLIIYMLLLDYEFDGKDMDILKSVVNIAHNLEKVNINTTDLLRLLKNATNITDKYAFFRTDIFWLISFSYDYEFINLYANSALEEKEKLYDWVSNCSRDKNTTDCIAHKFIGGGAYTGSMFNEDINIIFCTLILLTLQDRNYLNFIKIMSRIYPSINYDKITDIVKKNETIFNESYNKSIGKINKLLEVED